MSMEYVPAMIIQSTGPQCVAPKKGSNTKSWQDVSEQGLQGPWIFFNGVAVGGKVWKREETHRFSIEYV